MKNFLIAILVLLAVGCASIDATNNGYGNNNDNGRPPPGTCCGSVSRGIKRANAPQVYNTPHQTQDMYADGRGWFSGVTSQPVVFPSFVADPFPDPNGDQTINCLNQLELSAATLTLNGRNDIFFYDISCAVGSCPQQIQRYVEFVADIDPKPALVIEEYPLDEDPYIQSLVTFQVSAIGMMFNRSAVDPDRGCKVLYRALNASSLGVPNDPLFSHAIQNGDHIHSSLIVASDRTKPLLAQADDAWSNVMKVLSLAGADADDLLMVYVYLRNISDIAVVDTHYGTYVSPDNHPPRSVLGPNLFPLPSQAGALVGFRVIARTPERPNCPNPISTFNNPQVYRERPDLTSTGSTIGNFVYVGDTYPTAYAKGLSSIVTTPYFDPTAATAKAIDAMESAAAVRGADRKMNMFFEIHTSKPLSYYLLASLGITGSYNGTKSLAPAFNLIATEVPNSSPMSFNGVYWKNTESHGADPTPFMWSTFRNYFGMDLPYCDVTTIPNCPQPGWFFSSDPRTLNAALGSQGHDSLPRATVTAGTFGIDLSDLPPRYTMPDGTVVVLGRP